MRLGWLAALVVAAPALAQEAADDAEASKPDPVSWQVTNDFEIRYWQRPERLPEFPDRPVFNYIEQVNRLNIRVGHGKWTAFAQIDEVILAANRYRLDGELTWERDLVAPDVWSPWPGDAYLNPEKLTFQLKQGRTTVKLGDFYGSFGRGIALNVTRNVDIDIDTSIQGVSLIHRAGDWDVTALVGHLNRQQVFQDNPNIGIRGDFRHTVAGVRVERYGLGPATVGLHGTAWTFVDETGFGPGLAALGTVPDALVGGASVELFGVGGVDWYLESDLFGYPSRDLVGADDPSLGHATYASATAYLGPTIWLIEGKRYFNAERLNAALAPELYEAAIGPTLEYERSITEDSSATVNSNNVWGGRVRVDLALPGSATPFASVAVFRDLELGGLHFNTVPETVVHGLVGAEVYGEHVTVVADAGYRHDDRDATEHGVDRQIHADAELKFPLGDHLHADLVWAGEAYLWGINPLQQSDYFEMESAASLAIGGLVTVTWFTDFTDNPLVESTGNLTESLYGALEVQVKPLTALTVKGFYGAYKAGIRCSGGQCRQLPGFEGVRMSVVGTF